MKKTLFLFLALLLFTGCSLVDLHRDLKKIEKLSQIDVALDVKFQNNAQIIVVLIDLQNSTINDYRVVEEIRNVSFVIQPSLYQIIVFEDANKDYKYSPDEKSVYSQKINLTKKHTKYKVTLKLDDSVSQEETEYIVNLKKSLKLNISNSSLLNGEVVSLSSEIFNDENIKKGLWKSYSFVYNIPFGIFLEDEYDARKKVVLFIHGISGSPRNFKYIIDNLDKSKYQAFYAFYPSGISISVASKYLIRVITELKIRYGFDNIAIVGHSMGGLVSRSMMNDFSLKQNFVDTFITISSPLNGDKRANFGVNFAPDLMASVRDIASGSEFLNQLYKKPLAKGVKYHMIFGMKSDESTDGVVTILSQLRMDAQKEALSIRGYNEDHMSILNSKEVSQYIYSLLDANY